MKKLCLGIMVMCLLLSGCCPLGLDGATVRYQEDEIDDWDERPNKELLSETLRSTIHSRKAEKVGNEMKTEILNVIEYLHNEYDVYRAYCDDPIIFYNNEKYIPVIEFGFSLTSTTREETALKIEKELPIIADSIFTSVNYPNQILCIKVEVSGRVKEYQINYEDSKIILREE